MIPPLEGWPADDDSKPVLIGLTGPIGCGKSTVAGFLRDVGGLVIDADDLAREATAPNSPALPEIRERFGATVFSAEGKLDRAALAAIVFNDARALAELERIVHPRVRVLVDARLEAAVRERVPFVVIEAIKLVEGGLADRCDEVWIVVCQPTTQRARLSGRGATADDASRRLAIQGNDLAERLEEMLVERRVPVRRVSTDASLDETRELVEDALAEALDRQVIDRT
ncbi:MAG TPA: dephospho-CoA kinase [Candidatus Limnocylindrales bacterium]|jgi:dephospho-CoA kinase